MDCLSQSTAYILYEHLTSTLRSSPSRSESYEQFSRQLAAAPLKIQARSHTSSKEAFVTTTLEFLDDQGHVLRRITNFRQRYFDDPQVAQSFAPERPNSSIRPSWAQVHRRSTACITTGFSSELFSTSDGIWLRALAGQVLAPAGSPWHRAPCARAAAHALAAGPRRRSKARYAAGRRRPAGWHAHAVGRCHHQRGVGWPAVNCPRWRSWVLCRSGHLPQPRPRRGRDLSRAGPGDDLEFAQARVDEAVLASILSDDGAPCCSRRAASRWPGCSFAGVPRKRQPKRRATPRASCHAPWQIVACAPSGRAIKPRHRNCPRRRAPRSLVQGTPSSPFAACPRSP
ncbi:MAG: hypothetical protein R2838_04080 [Caldilineaceae bacterium]